MNHELAKTLTTALVQFIDRGRPEGSMCCSNTDCENIEGAFEEGEYEIVESFIKHKLSRLTEFEKCMLDFAKARDEYVFDSTKVLDDKIIKLTKSYSKKLIALAKDELLSYADESNPAIEAMADLERTYFCNPDKLPKWLKDDIARKELNAHTKGYNKGYKDAEEDNKAVSYHFVAPDNWPPKMPDLPTQITTNDIQSNAIPHWKPSEEQMKALQCAIVIMEIREASDYDISPLKELYEQLKKLM